METFVHLSSHNSLILIFPSLSVSLPPNFPKRINKYKVLKKGFGTIKYPKH